MRALVEARAQGRSVLVATRLTRSSCRSLVSLVDRLVAHGVAGWAVVWPRVTVVDEAVSRTVPRLGIAVPHALRAVQRAVRRGLPTVLVGVPQCTLGPFGVRRLAQPRGGGAFARVCDGCAARPECPGVEPWYLDRFGDEELRPVASSTRAPLDETLAEGLARAAQASEAPR